MTRFCRWTWSTLFLLVACGDDGDGDGGADAGGSMPMETAATWTEIWDDVIVGTGCNGNALCHAADTGGLALLDKDESHAALVDVAAKGTNLEAGGTDCVDTGLIRVIPGDPDNSLLMQKLLGTQTCGDTMPPGGMLTSEQLEMFRNWIAAGAKND